MVCPLLFILIPFTLCNVFIERFYINVALFGLPGNRYSLVRCDIIAGGKIQLL
jgi:hypothetical protein